MSSNSNLSNVVVEQRECPKCPSSDAFTEYDDGHCKCYSCGYFLPAGRVIRINKKKEDKQYVVCFPSDSNSDLPVSALEWLNKYEITLAEAREHKFKWSEERQLLIFPVYGNDSTLLFWQGRYFGKEKKPKYDSRGKNQEVLHILNVDASDEIIVTEDLLSAIKVSRQQTAMPLWGSHITLNQFKRLFRLFGKVRIWLDSDKFKEAIELASIGSQLGLTEVIRTELDPKCYTDLEIKEILK